MKFDVIVADPPFSFSDKLTMSNVPRGAESQYTVLDGEALVNLDVKSIAADDSILVLWVPSSLLGLGMRIMESWGFQQTQTFVWVKCKKNPLENVIKEVIRSLLYTERYSLWGIKDVMRVINELDINNILGFFMGRLFRQTHEIALVGKRGKIYDKLNNKSQRSVIISPNNKHSSKPEGLQDQLDLMFSGNKLELFARRQREGWTCVGLEMPNSEDIKASIKRLTGI